MPSVARDVLSGEAAWKGVSASLLTLLVKGWRPVPRSRALARCLFGVDFLPVGKGDQYFDVTTPLLVRAAARRLTRESRFLDMGTGAFAVIGLALWRRTGCHVVCSDIHPRILEQAQANVSLNRAPIQVVHSRFFDQLDGEFDVVTFNPPYIPSHLAQDPTYARPFDFQSNGGADGSAVIAEFFDAFAARGGRATACLGMNELFVSGKKVVALVQAHKDLVVEQVDRVLGSPFYVLVIGRAAAGGPRAAQGG